MLLKMERNFKKLLDNEVSIHFISIKISFLPTYMYNHILLVLQTVFQLRISISQHFSKDSREYQFFKYAQVFQKKYLVAPGWRL